MKEIKSNFQVLKAVKKNTYNSINKLVNLNANEDKKKNIIQRSISLKNFHNFVPNLKPKKSTFVPTPLKLNPENKIFKEKDDFDNKQLSEDEIEIVDDGSSCSSLSSSDLDSSFNEEEIDEAKDRELKTELLLKNDVEKIESKDADSNCDSFNLYDIKECIDLEDGKSPEVNKNMKGLRRRMSQIKAKADIVKSKEANEIISDNFKNNFDIGLKKNEESDDKRNLYCSVNFFDHKFGNIKPKSKSIFEVISLSKQSLKK